LSLSFERARHIEALAKQHCCKGQDDCAWYHGFWHYLRWLGLGCDAWRHRDFFLTELEKIHSRDGLRPEVLVSGTADESMLSLVVDAIGTARVTVIDRCQTPLLLCTEFAAKRGLAISTWQGDIRDASWQASFDVIATHVFLGYFDEDGRSEVIKSWFRMLKLGGSVVTVQRLRPGFSRPTVGFSPKELSEFCQAVDQGLANHGIAAEIRRETVAKARIYGERFLNFAILSADNILDAFKQAGFRLEQYETETPPSRTGAGSGPSVSDGAIFLKIVAVKDHP
jgi:SAM-dependent methyltransferase